MSEYSAYGIGPGDRIMLRIDLVCDGDDAAKERAAELVDEYPIELWKGGVLLARFDLFQ